MSDERAEACREVIAELVEMAQRHAASYQELHEAAAEHGRGLVELTTRAYANWNAWMEAVRVLRMDPMA